MHVAEAEEQDENDMDEDADGHEALEAVQEEEAEPGLDDDEEFQQLQSMLEVMATEMDEAAAAGCDEEELAGLEEKMDDAVEALVTLREARTQINAMKKDRGYHGSKNFMPKSNKKPGGPSGKPNKKETTCFVCGLPGHWQGDPECRGAGGGSKSSSSSMPKFPKPMKKPQNFRGGPPKPEVHSAEANVVDLLSTNSVMFSGLDEVHEIHMTDALRPGD